ncbi:alpha-D-ribose 1-methylphosphonate 5-triphosphate diphosphatase [Roseicitreum antarcticum]|uniref:Alpha-D-ribose 1-methylphosphonate 5-triphosphate diphosphatase n=1 Tax=Roseicitreum antarcticum TaxID=564137 RepID=A0A1H2UIA0_9RHOB|nr:alpha-D-ribose 1-methylphosphonate 5-triphosphate diphosphatase [Roseicitreum antarcticum]SDW55820.1 alpha-D-ribose 1-methylphosphonate 5-triphosphate diphosphatase [Roseicitreum antarcticum]
MTSLLPPVRLTGALCLIDGALHDTDLTIADGHLADMPGADAADLSGYWLLPGIIDLHGDGFEHHLSPRPTAPFDTGRALLAADAELATNGVTTAWFAQSWSWEGGTRSPDKAEEIMAAIAAQRAQFLTDIRLQIRFETHVTDGHDRLLRALARYGVDYIAYNNHLPEALEQARDRPDRFANWAASQGRTPQQLLDIIHAAKAHDPQVPDLLAALAPQLAGVGVQMASHDDGDAETRAFFRARGARICEFPTTPNAARAAKDAGEPVLMGAPNVVRGGSQAGNIAAQDLIEDGLCDALVSDYYAPALALAAWALADRGVCSFSHAWEMISTSPARIFGLTDRGNLRAGQRADLVIMNPATRRIEGTIANGQIAHLSGGAAARLMRPRTARALAAE